jgi:hypothetical protein
MAFVLRKKAAKKPYIVCYMEKSTMKISRTFSMANKDTFKCLPIKPFVEQYLQDSKVSIDPFARNYNQCTHTNDLNPKTKAQHHMKAEFFLQMLVEQEVKADLVIFDPPYSMTQCKRAYESFGYKFTYDDSLYVINWTREKNLISKLLPKGGIFLHFGWNSNGMGLKRGFHIEEILLVSHGSAKNDTICMAERRTSEQLTLFPYNKPVQRTQKTEPLT